MHHQGIFRVSGSQVEISNFREGFERGEDPLADTTDASDINSIAGVLKLYLRELREPLFPIIYFDHFVALARKHFQKKISSKFSQLILKTLFFFRIGIKTRTCRGYTKIFTKSTKISCNCYTIFVCIFKSVSFGYSTSI